MANETCRLVTILDSAPHVPKKGIEETMPEDQRDCEKRAQHEECAETMQRQVKYYVL